MHRTRYTFPHNLQKTVNVRYSARCITCKRLEYSQSSQPQSQMYIKRCKKICRGLSFKIQTLTCIYLYRKKTTDKSHSKSIVSLFIKTDFLCG